MEVDDATEVEDDETFLRNYYEAYAVFKANNPVSVHVGDMTDLVTTGHDLNYPENIVYLKMMYPYIIHDNARAQAEVQRKQKQEKYMQELEEAEQRRIQALVPTISLQPNEKYAPYIIFEHTMQPIEDTPFDSLFVRYDPSSMLLYMHLHGTLLIGSNGEPVIKDAPRGVMINKFSMSGTGKCNSSPVSSMQGILYRLCDAVQRRTPIDMETILNQTNAHDYAKIVGPERALSVAPSMSTQQHNIGIKNQSSAKTAKYQTQSYDKRFAETLYGDVPDNNKHTYGNKYVEKYYDIEHDGIARDGIFICKDWSEIGANCMDNLMNNNAFKSFILKKYNDEKKISNLTLNLDIDGTQYVSLKHATLTDVLEFCAKFGRPKVSMVDSSCSNFMTKNLQSVTNRQIKNASEFLKNPIYDNVAKGVKRTKKGNRYNKTTRVKGNRGKPKRTKKGKRVIKNKRTRGR